MQSDEEFLEQFDVPNDGDDVVDDIIKPPITKIPTAQERFRKFIFLVVFSGLFFLLIGMRIDEEEYYATRNLDKSSVDYYEVLGISRAANTKQIKKQFRQLASKFHPDKNPSCEECRKKFIEINEAYDTLSDDHRRSLYDNTMSVNVEGIKPAYTHVITASNYDDFIKRDVVLMIHHDIEPASGSFFGVFEHMASKLDGFVPFGVIDAARSKDIIQRLPIRIKIYPTVLIISSRSTSILNLSAISGVEDFKFWIQNHLPKNYIQLDESSVKDFIEKESNNRILVAYTGKKPPLMLNAGLEGWQSILDVGIIQARNLPKNMKVSENGVFTFKAGQIKYTHHKISREWKKLPYLLKYFSSELIVPIRSYNSSQLCEGLPDIRQYCLIVEDDIKMKGILKNNHLSFKKWIADEEIIPLIQVVSLKTSNLSLPLVVDYQTNRITELVDDTGERVEPSDVHDYLGSLNFRSFPHLSIQSLDDFEDRLPHRHESMRRVLKVLKNRIMVGTYVLILTSYLFGISFIPKCQEIILFCCGVFLSSVLKI